MSRKTALIAFGVPALYAVVLRLFFGIDTWEKLFSVMSVTFLFGLPTIIGTLTVYLSSPERAAKRGYRIFAPWVSVGLFLLITLALYIEGWACWIMILPLFLFGASIGGLIGGYLKGRKSRNKLHVSVLVLLPFLAGPIESTIDSIPATYKAYTYIDIAALPQQIWPKVTRVSEIPVQDDKGYLTDFLGFPRPVKAELNYNGVGAYREAIFSKGLVFHETVTKYTENQHMSFTIKAYPHEIPSTTMDEHVVIGGDYFDVLNGTYELEALPNGLQRLHLYSHFEMNTRFNFYAGWWGKLIMKDIQNNILRIIKKRAESTAANR